MASYTKKEFADLCGITTKYLSVPIKRGQIILIDDKIEITEPKNLAFYKKRQKSIPLSENNSTQISETPNENKNEPPVPPLSTKNSGKALSYHQLDIELKQADLSKKEVDTRLALLKEEKMMGLSIPTEIVKIIIANLSKSMVSAQKDGVDYFLIEISKRKSLSSSETAELRGVLVDIINTSSIRAITEAKKNLKIAISEFSDKKDVGEHD